MIAWGQGHVQARPSGSRLTTMGHPEPCTQPSCVGALPSNRIYLVTAGMAESGQKATSVLLFDHLVGKLLQRERQVEADGLGGLEVDGQIVLGGKLHRQIGDLCTRRIRRGSRMTRFGSPPCRPAKPPCIRVVAFLAHVLGGAEPDQGAAAPKRPRPDARPTSGRLLDQWICRTCRDWAIAMIDQVNVGTGDGERRHRHGVLRTFAVARWHAGIKPRP
jgi:hypothetical protein